MRHYLRSLTLRILWFGAHRQYRSDHPVVIAIGGSVGKTSTKEAVALMVEQAGYLVTKTQGNMATDFGVALSLLGYSDTPAGATKWLGVIFRSLFMPTRKYSPGKPHYYVLEYSSDTVGDTAYLTSKIAPDVAILTTLVPVHMEQYGSEEAMVEETVSLIDAVPEHGVVIANYDDAPQRKALTKAKLGNRTLLWYGLAKNALPKQTGIWATDVVNTVKGIKTAISSGAQGMDALSKPSKGFTVQTAVVGNYQLYPLLAATAVASYYKFPMSSVKQGLEKFQLPAGRGRLIEGKNGVTIIDDTANASPEAVKAGLSVLKPFAGERRRVAILGTMNELGAISESAHKDIAQAAARESMFFIALGKYAQVMVEAAKQAGMDSHNVMGFATPEQCMGHLGQLIKRNDVVYIKASQNGMYLERIVKALMAKPEQAPDLLVRQGSYWNKR